MWYEGRVFIIFREKICLQMYMFREMIQLELEMMQNMERGNITVVHSSRVIKSGGIGWKYRPGEYMSG